MPTTYKTYIYPGIGKSGGKELAKISDLPGEFTRAINLYLNSEGLDDTQGIRLPGLVKAKDMLVKAKTKAGKNPLTVRGGIDSNGDLVVTVSGLLPEKSGGQPEKYEKITIVREDFKKLVKEMKTEEHAVVNLHPGNDVIDGASEAQSKKFKTPVQYEGSMDVGKIKTGTVVLAAHGGAAAVSGTVLGTSLGHKTPQEIVDLLTKNSDKSKRLSKKFTGTVLLSGCYTASGNMVIPEDYDYSVFAGEVKRLLETNGYKGFVVRGIPGPATTIRTGPNTGGKKGIHGMKFDDTAKEALQQQLDKLYQKMKGILEEHNNNAAEAVKDERLKPLYDQYQRIKKEKDEVIREDDKAGLSANLIEGLIGTFGLRVR
jgi:hypothetical protein